MIEEEAHCTGSGAASHASSIFVSYSILCVHQPTELKLVVGASFLTATLDSHTCKPSLSLVSAWLVSPQLLN